MFWGPFLIIFLRPWILISSGLMSVQNGGPHFIFTRFDGAPIFGLRALKKIM